MTSLDDRRLQISQSVDRARRAALGQFFTSSQVAGFMSSLFSLPDHGRITLLEPGAGIGSLASAFMDRAAHLEVDVTCYEIEPLFAEGLRETLSSHSCRFIDIRQRDFLEDAVRLITAGRNPQFDFAILNPPYRKIAANSPHRLLLRKLNVETSNLYSCFLAGTVALCRPGAQVVAIVPRSFMNGVYFRPFRLWLLERAALASVHVFDSRNRAFADDDVLQENVILRLDVGREPGPVTVSVSSDQTLSDVRSRVCSFNELVRTDDPELFIHIPSVDRNGSLRLDGQGLREIGLDVCTGPIVDFRLKDYLLAQPEPGAVPLLYAAHFSSGQLEWPKSGRKPNAILRNPFTEKWLMPKGCYVVTRRFTSKEEKRRIVAHVMDGTVFDCDAVAFENHLNVIHKDRHGLPLEVARGLAAYLNSEKVNDFFRTFSGHTQVNATDLRSLKYPDIPDLIKAGTRVPS